MCSSDLAFFNEATKPMPITRLAAPLSASAVPASGSAGHTSCTASVDPRPHLAPSPLVIPRGTASSIGLLREFFTPLPGVMNPHTYPAPYVKLRHGCETLGIAKMSYGPPRDQGVVASLCASLEASSRPGALLPMRREALQSALEEVCEGACLRMSRLVSMFDRLAKEGKHPPARIFIFQHDREDA